jgi:hypothetical protein
MTLPPRLQRELNELRAAYDFAVLEDPDFINLVFRTFPLGGGFTTPHSDLLLRVPRSYPDAGPDMFWVETSVLLESGRPPQAAEAVEHHLSREWRRFSWHRQGTWNPNVDNMHGHLEFIHRRLREKK